MPEFNLLSEFKPRGDQPRAIKELNEGIERKEKYQVLLGVTGSGKTFTMANVIARAQKPTLIISHNKTLAAQLYEEFKYLFPENAVEYFVSYYDYYQPEAYIPKTDTYIAKDSSINDRIDKMRHAATHSLFTRNDVIIVASVSCIYGLGSPETYHDMLVFLTKEEKASRDEVLAKLIEIQYERNDIDFSRGTFRARGDVVEVFPSYEENRAIRIQFFGDYVETISVIDPLRGKIISELDRIAIYPGNHYVVSEDKRNLALQAIKEELRESLAELRSHNKLLEAQRLEQRTNYDLEMIEEIGYCTGIENYSRHMEGRSPGEPPPALLNYFPDDYLIFIDESHVTIPQLTGMYRGDRSRKESLVRYGFRLPSALDNRPYTFEEFEERTGQIIYVSATPAKYEFAKSKGNVVEQIIRPTGLMDPVITVKPAATQVDNLLNEIRLRIERGEKTLVTTLTKRMAEDLTSHYADLGVKVRYLHSDIDTLERVELIKDLRLGKFDVLIGVNLLREGLDIPEVSLVAILDADKEGFLRSERSLIQTCGRAARNVAGEVIMYGDIITKSMRITLDETIRRRKIQKEFNRKNNITPESIKKTIHNIFASIYEADHLSVPVVAETEEKYASNPAQIPQLLKNLKKEMMEAAKSLEFEKAAEIRDRIKELETLELYLARP